MKNKPKTHSGVKLGALAIFFACACQAKEKETKQIQYADKLLAISNCIEATKAKYPQLDSFSTLANADTARLKIVYRYNTHRSNKSGGWTAGVPNPDSNGVWLYIDFHDPSSSAQIHTQPFQHPLYIGDLAVSYLILEGSRTNTLHSIIYKILEENGVYSKPFPKK